MKPIDELRKAVHGAHATTTEASEAEAAESAREDLAHEAKLNSTTALDAAKRAIRRDI